MLLFFAFLGVSMYSKHNLVSLRVNFSDSSVTKARELNEKKISNIQQEYNVFDYGAVNDSTVSSTKGINDAIVACHKNGGGKVVLPAGVYLSGTIILKSNVELHFENGAKILASKNAVDFPMQPITNYRSLKEGNGWFALIFAANESNISISGNGIIDGQGRGRKGTIKGFGGDIDGRPRNILFISCKKVNVSGLEMFNASMWNQHYLDCEDVNITNIKVFNHANGNNDGIDIDGCRRFVLSNSIIDSDDDGIVLKSTGTAACENITINNCIVSSFANAIKCGTESTGGFKNILISNCIVNPSENKGHRIIKSTPSGITAISLEIVDGGIMDGVIINNILIDGTECPLYVRLGNRARKHRADAPEPSVGQMRNVYVSNIRAYNTGNFGASVTAIPDHKIENIHLDNIFISNRGGLKEGDFTDISKKDVKRHDTAGHATSSTYLASHFDVVEDDKGYPQPTVWGNLPSYGIFIRHVKDFYANNVVLKNANFDPRVPIIAVDVDNLYLKEINVNSKQSRRADVLINNVKQKQIDKILFVRSVVN